MRVAALALLSLFACRGAAVEPSVPTTTPRIEPRPVAASPEEPALPAVLGPDIVLLQIDLEPTYALAIGRNLYERHGRVPVLTLYADGTLLFAGAWEGRDWLRQTQGVFYRTHDPAFARALHRRVLDLGVLTLAEDHDWCVVGGICGTDQAHLELAIRDPDGGLVERRAYLGCQPRPDDPLAIAYAELERLALTTETSHPYRPTRASVYLQRLGSHKGALAAWPLSDALFTAASARERSVLVLAGDDLEHLTATMRTSNGSAVLHHGDAALHVDVVPWLPGEDHSAAIARDPERLRRPSSGA